MAKNLKSFTYGKVTGLAAGVAAGVASTTADTESRTVSLDVTKALAVVALLGYCKCKCSASKASVKAIFAYSR